MTNEEWVDFGKVVEIYESALKKCFNATYFNWGCFLNDAYRNEPYNAQVHWQVRPRYEKSGNFEGNTFKDDEFGHQFLRKDMEVILSDEMINKVYNKLLPYFRHSP